MKVSRYVLRNDLKKAGSVRVCVYICTSIYVHMYEGVYIYIHIRVHVCIYASGRYFGLGQCRRNRNYLWKERTKPVVMKTERVNYLLSVASARVDQGRYGHGLEGKDKILICDMKNVLWKIFVHTF